MYSNYIDILSFEIKFGTPISPFLVNVLTNFGTFREFLGVRGRPLTYSVCSLGSGVAAL